MGKLPEQTPSFAERRAVAESSISQSELKDQFVSAPSLRSSRCFEESPRNINVTVRSKFNRFIINYSLLKLFFILIFSIT